MMLTSLFYLFSSKPRVYRPDPQDDLSYLYCPVRLSDDGLSNNFPEENAIWCYIYEPVMQW